MRHHDHRVRFAGRAAERTKAAGIRVSDGIQEALENVREIRATNQEGRYLAGLNQKIDEHEKIMIKGELSTGLFVNAASVIMRLGVATTILVGANLILSGQIDFMLLFLFLLVITRVYAPFDQSLALIAEMFISQVSADRMNEIYNTPTAEGAETFWPQGHDIVFEHVGFSYDEKEVLHDVSFTLRPGQTLGVVGPTGCGKSTLLNLIMKFYTTPEGMLFVGGRDIRQTPALAIREKTGYVPQEGFLFSGTLWENIAFYQQGAGDEEVHRAAETAGLTVDLEQLPNGLETMVGERGAHVSGGQRQRTALARALIRNPELLLLDDTLSAVDNHTQAVVLGNLEKLRGTRSAIIVAHKLSAVQHADEILYMERGCVKERGTHEELLAKNGVYAELYRYQFRN